MMRVRKGWIERFALEVPRSIRRRLINLGLPVAGLEFEVKNDGSVVFDGGLRVSRDGKFYWGRRQLTTREFVNVASLLSHYDAELVEELSRFVDLRSVRVINGTDLKVGRVVLEEAAEAWAMCIIKKHLAALRNRIFPGAEVVYFQDGMSVIVRRPPFRVEANHYYDDTVNDDVDLYYRSVYACPLEVWDFEDALYYRDVEEVVKVADKTVFGAIHKGVGSNYRVFSYWTCNIYEFSDATIVIDEDSSDPFEVYEGIDRTFINGGWRFYYVDGKNSFYRKRVGAIRLKYGRKAMKMFFANGVVYSAAEPGILLHSKDLNTYFDVLSLL